MLGGAFRPQALPPFSRARRRGGVVSLPDLPAITGATEAGGLALGNDNTLSTTSAKGVKLPSGATSMPRNGSNGPADWTLLVVWQPGDVNVPGGSRREMLASFGTPANTAVPINGAVVSRGQGTSRRKLLVGKRTANVNGTGDWIGGAAGAVTDTGHTLLENTPYLLAFGQTGSTPTVRVYNLLTGAAVGSTYVGAANDGATSSFYFDSTGAARASTNFDNFVQDFGGIFTGAPTDRQGATGVLGGIAHCHAYLSDAQLAQVASGALSMGSLPSLRYWNTLTAPAAGVSVAAQATDRNGNALPVTGAATLQATGVQTVPTAGGPFRTGGQIRLQTEHYRYVFPLTPSSTPGAVRATGRAWFDGVSSAVGYPIFGRLVRTDGTVLVDWTQLTASHPGGAFSFPLDGVPSLTNFYREVWTGPTGATIGGAAGHAFRERNPMRIDVRLLWLGQSQENYNFHPGASGTGTGATLDAAPGAGAWFNMRGPFANAGVLVTNFQNTPSAMALLQSAGPRDLSLSGPGASRLGAAQVGDGVMEGLNRIAALVGGGADVLHGARSGHSVDAFAYDRTTWTRDATGSGTSRSATLTVPDPDFTAAGSTGTTGVEPGSITVAWSGGTITDAANAGFTGAQLTGVQTFPAAAGVTGTINYATGALALTFGADPGAVTATFTTRFDTSAGNQPLETGAGLPDKFTLWGSDESNGEVRRLHATAPRHGYSAVVYAQATAGISDFGSSTDVQFAEHKTRWRNKLARVRDRVWALCPPGQNPPIVLQVHGRGATGGDPHRANIRRAQYEIAFAENYDPALATDGGSGATASAWCWHMGIRDTQTLEANAGEHQDAQITGGRRYGAVAGVGVAALMLGSQAFARGPRFTSAAIVPGSPHIIEATATLYRPGATALVTDGAYATGLRDGRTIPAGDPNNLKEFVVTANPTSNYVWTQTTAITVSLVPGTDKVRIARNDGQPWFGAGVTSVRMAYKVSGPFLSASPSEATRTADETDLASALFDNSGGFGGTQPGAAVEPCFGLLVSA